MQVRNHLQIGQPPGMVARGAKGHRPTAAFAGSGTVHYTAEGLAAEDDQPDDPEWALTPGEAPGLDLRSFV